MRNYYSIGENSKKESFIASAEPMDKLTTLLSETLIYDSNHFVILIDHEFFIKEITPSLLKLLELETADLVGENLISCEQKLPFSVDLIRQCIQYGFVHRNYPVKIVREDFSREMIMDVLLLKDNDNIVGAGILFKELTDLFVRDDQLKWVERISTIGQIAAGAAHEIRNPLTSVRGFLQLLGRSEVLRGKDKELSYIHLMLQEIDRINHLVNEFLLLSKQRERNMKKVFMQNVLNDLLPVILSEAMLKNVAVEQVSEDNVPYVIADTNLIKQVILNLSKNAFDAMPRGGNIKIELSNDIKNQFVVIRVRDNGCGIPSFLFDKIFDPFFTTKEKGTGLGLSICQQIVHDHGGQIRVQSKGYGTTFQITLPYAGGE